jgi:L-lactate dehydrogenase complex protein LldE
MAALRTLRRLGVDVEFDSRQTCCGQPAFNSGYVDQARSVALQFLKVFGQADFVVVPSGSCATMIKIHLPELFAESSTEAELAQQVGRRTYELSDFIVSVLRTTETGARFNGKVTFHDSCHQLRDLGISNQPRQLIRSVEGVTFTEMKNAERCCGFGGTFAVKFPDVSCAIGEDKIQSILETGADYVIANDVSCLMHINGLLKRGGHSVKTMHLAELLAK